MIELKQLSKNFGQFTAVDSVTFEVPVGQILGFLGPNGAGKSTTMKMLTGFIEPTSGSATIDGKDIVDEALEVKRLVGYLPESAPSYGEMTVREFLGFVAEIRGKFGQNRNASVGEMLETCFLEEVADQTIETLSKGYRQRVGFAQALIHDPPVLILDEPTDGLDPNQKHEVRQLIKRMASNKTIVLSTHILEEVEAICQRVVIIANGKLVADSTPEQLMAKSRLHNAVTMQFTDDSWEKARSVCADIQTVSDVEVIGEHRKVLRVYPRDGQSIIQTLSDVAREKSWPVQEMRVETGRLDEVFREVTLSQRVN